jgi:tetratricopeptide (TPR) repeat protein
LVPIETNLGEENPYLMGRIDPDLMYDIVMKWDWGNSERTDIYHDPETRKNSISFRSNMARLAEILINEEKFEKARDIIDLAIEKMPIDYFGYYSLLVPFVDGYFRMDEVEKARDLSGKIAVKYSDRLSYFNSLEANLQYAMGEEIITEIERYRTLIEASLKHAEKNELSPILNTFLDSIEPFKYLYGDYEFYTGLVDVVEGYYLEDTLESAQSLSKKISEQYSNRIQLFSQIPEENQR